MSQFLKLKVVLAHNYTRVATVPTQITLDQVHDLIQVLFDWDDDHLWEFEDAVGRRFSPHDGDDLSWSGNRGLLPSENFCLGDVLPERGATLKYTYDFGDIDGLETSEEEYRTPTVEELTKRMQPLDLTPRPKKPSKSRHAPHR